MKHLRILGIDSGRRISLSKPRLRAYHSFKKNEKLIRSATLLNDKIDELLPYFANGDEVEPESISPELIPVSAGSFESDMFRLAALTWSVPVSEGFGRRMRYLVWDKSNDRLIGLLALGDPVFNLRVRDEHIGWSGEDRKRRLCNCMDAYVLGAVPPYSSLLCGKLIACLIKSRDIRDGFRQRYGQERGIISNELKNPRLVMVTTTSALGRSSVYNRVRLNGESVLESIGYTAGYGHFHVPDPLFKDMRRYLEMFDDRFAINNSFGEGPNWKFRTIRTALEQLDLSRDALYHGIPREVFVINIAKNSIKYLNGCHSRPIYPGLKSVRAISELALERWVIPRASRKPEFRRWRRSYIVRRLRSK